MRTRRRRTHTPRSSESSPEVLEEALEFSMLAGDAGPLHPPDVLAVAAMSLSTYCRAIVWAQVSRRKRRRYRKRMGATSLNRRVSFVADLLWNRNQISSPHGRC